MRLVAMSDKKCGPYYCADCGEQLVRNEIHDCEHDRPMGHIWYCLDCNKRFVGFGDEGEYDGSEGGLGAEEAAVAKARYLAKRAGDG